MILSLKKPAGFTLIEIMLSISISLIVLQVLLDVYLSSLNIIREIKSMQQIRYQAALATNVLASDIKKSGYIGCQMRLNSISGSSSRISLNHMTYPSEKLLEPMRVTTEMIIGKHITLHTGDLLMVSDCEHAETFTAKKVWFRKKGQVIEAMTPLKYHYNGNADIGRYEKRSYFINHDRLTLSMLENNKNEDMVTGVAGMNVHYYVSHPAPMMEITPAQVTDKVRLSGIGIDLELVDGNRVQPWHIYIALI